MAPITLFDLEVKQHQENQPTLPKHLHKNNANFGHLYAKNAIKGWFINNLWCHKVNMQWWKHTQKTCGTLKNAW